MRDPRIEHPCFAHCIWRERLTDRQIDQDSRLSISLHLEDPHVLAFYAPATMSMSKLDKILSLYHEPKYLYVSHFAFRHAHPAPPITAACMQPMLFDAGMKMQPKLRQDINFDMEVFFRPSGSHNPSQPDPRRAEQYWMAIQCELEYWVYLRGARERNNITEADIQESSLGRQSRLQRMFEELVELTNLVIPVRFRQEVREVVDPPRRVRNIKEGVLPDYRALADYMRDKLLPACAPERDAWVERVTDSIAALAVEGDAEAIANALKELFGLLFGLKLDLGNNLVRSGRAYMIGSNSIFWQNYWARRQELGAFDPRPCLAWYEHGLERPTSGRLEQADHLRHLASRFITSLRGCIRDHTPHNHFSEIWRYDSSRLAVIVAQIEALAAQGVCIHHLERLLRTHPRSATPNLIQRFTERLPTIVGDASYQSMAGYIALEIAQMLPNGPAPGSAGVSRTARSAEGGRGTTAGEDEYTVLPHDRRAESASFPAPYGPPGSELPTQPTQFMAPFGAPAIGSQILPVRETAATSSSHTNDGNLVDDIEAALNRDLSHSSPVLASAVNHIFMLISARLSSSLIEHIDLEPWQLSDRFVGRTPAPSLMVPGIQYCRNYLTVARERAEVPPGPRLIDIIDRVTHMLAIHWQWAGPAYYAPGATGKCINHITEAPEKVRGLWIFKEDLDEVPWVRDMTFADCLPGARQRLAEEGIENQLELVCADDKALGGRYGIDYSGRLHPNAERETETRGGTAEGEAGPSRAGQAR